MPQEIDIAPEDYPLVNHSRIFTLFWTDGVVAKPAPRGGANWPPSSYDPATNYYYVCGTDSINLFKGGVENQEMPRAGRGEPPDTPPKKRSPGTSIFAALDMKTNRLVWRQDWKDSCYSGSMTTTAGAPAQAYSTPAFSPSAHNSSW